MKTRFEMSSPLPTRHSSTRVNASVPPKSRTLSKRPSEKPATSEVPAEAPDMTLEDELPAAELELFSQSLIAQLDDQKEATNILDTLPSYIRVCREYTEALAHKKEQLSITKAMVKAAEPVINNPMIAEQDKQGLLEVTGLALEKMMQIKMRLSNIKERLKYMQKMVPQYALNHAKHMGYSEPFCNKLAEQAKALL